MPFRHKPIFNAGTLTKRAYRLNDLFSISIIGYIGIKPCLSVLIPD